MTGSQTRSSIPPSVGTPGQGTPDRPGHAKRKYGWKSCSCMAALAGSVFFLILLIIVVIAETGLLHIPVISLIYQRPAPTRLVKAGLSTRESLLSRVSNEINKSIRAGHEPPYQVTVTEQDVTAVLKDVLTENEQELGILTEDAQVVILPDGLEISGRYIRGALTYDLNMKVDVRIEQERIHFELVRAMLGNIPVPSQVLLDIAGAVFKRDVLTWDLAFGDIRPESIELRDGELFLFLSPGR